MKNSTGQKLNLFVEDVSPNSFHLAKPLKFYMAPSDERQRIKPLIMSRGGLFVKSATEISATKSTDSTSDVIYLVRNGHKAVGENCVSVKFIDDSIEKNCLQDINRYRVKKGESVMIDEVQTDEKEDSKTVYPSHGRLPNGRLPFLIAEDKAIIKFILEENAESKVAGTTIWKKMDMLKICGNRHTWQSLKCRFEQVILVNLATYNLSEVDIQRLQPNKRRRTEKARMCSLGFVKPASSKAAAKVTSGDDSDDVLQPQACSPASNKSVSIIESSVNRGTISRRKQKNKQGDIQMDEKDGRPENESRSSESASLMHKNTARPNATSIGVVTRNNSKLIIQSPQSPDSQNSPTSKEAVRINNANQDLDTRSLTFESFVSEDRTKQSLNTQSNGIKSPLPERCISRIVRSQTHSPTRPLHQLRSKTSAHNSPISRSPSVESSVPDIPTRTISPINSISRNPLPKSAASSSPSIRSEGLRSFVSMSPHKRVKVLVEADSSEMDDFDRSLMKNAKKIHKVVVDESSDCSTMSIPTKRRRTSHSNGSEKTSSDKDHNRHVTSGATPDVEIHLDVESSLPRVERRKVAKTNSCQVIPASPMRRDSACSDLPAGGPKKAMLYKDVSVHVSSAKRNLASHDKLTVEKAQKLPEVPVAKSAVFDSTNISTSAVVDSKKRLASKQSAHRTPELDACVTSKKLQDKVTTNKSGDNEADNEFEAFSTLPDSNADGHRECKDTKGKAKNREAANRSRLRRLIVNASDASHIDIDEIQATNKVNRVSGNNLINSVISQRHTNSAREISDPAVTRHATGRDGERSQWTIDKSKSISNSPPKNAANNSTEGNSSNTYNSRKIEDTLQAMIDWLQVSPQHMMQAVFMCSGDVDDAVHWILTGITPSGTPAWEPELDHILMLDESSWGVLQKQFKEEQISDRIKFLADFQFSLLSTL